MEERAFMDDLFEYCDVLNAPFQAFSGDWKTVRPHWHYFTEMVYLVRGNLTVEIEGRTYTMEAGDMAIFFPKQIHAFMDYPENKYPLAGTETAEEGNRDGLFFYVIKFDEMILSNTTPGSPKLPRILGNITREKQRMNLVQAQDLRFNPVKLFFENCIWEVKHREFGYDIKVASTISLIITELVRIWMRHGLEICANSSSDQFSYNDFSVLEYIDSHSADMINIEELAQKCGMCYSNFAKHFKAQFGRTCKEYIEFVRVCKADTMLLYTDRTLDYISQETGFTDASHFIRTYKKIRGITPKQRRMTRR